jgi:hypothetical protein
MNAAYVRSSSFPTTFYKLAEKYLPHNNTKRKQLVNILIVLGTLQLNNTHSSISQAALQ